ncbi:hypothetical protein [Pseudonocardia kunmingensis]|uniref:Uncharacterized protein n=1 Tax=Pseudonocardia kunmingensis TaxID=630975 RepID=A0A543E3I9_9PSEU|nr:hypothetical protein [Pseudonocardia kunmingensis]TQM16158.1 hypothetical protein FB558_2965 [Pseudonocardia kunmingensis]
MTGAVGNEEQRSARSLLGALGRRWPTALGLAAAASSISELVGGTPAAGVEEALIIAIPVLVYLSAAVLDRPRSAWPVTLGAVALVFGMSELDIEPVLGLAATSGAVLIVGIGRRLRSGADMPDARQIVGALGFGTAAVLALYLAPTLGGVLVGLGLVGHAAWDVYHHRRDIVVVRSLAEFCAVLDLLVGAAVIVLIVATAT